MRDERHEELKPRYWLPLYHLGREDMYGVLRSFLAVLLEELIASDVPVVIVDARTGPRTDKNMVEHLQNRTLTNVPLRLLDRPFGIVGVATFGDEGLMGAPGGPAATPARAPPRRQCHRL